MPRLWDRTTGRVLSNDFKTIGIDLATRFRRFGHDESTYPDDLREDIEDLDRWLGPDVNHGVAVTDASGDAARAARATLQAAFEKLDERLSTQRFLLGDKITEADVRLWVSLVRSDSR